MGPEVLNHGHAHVFDRCVHCTTLQTADQSYAGSFVVTDLTELARSAVDLSYCKHDGC